MKKPTATSMVFEALIAADDFRTGLDLQEETGLDCNHVSAALIHLLRHKAVESIEEGDKRWWFATPWNDSRFRTVDERTPEKRPRKPRPRKITATALAYRAVVIGWTYDPRRTYRSHEYYPQVYRALVW